MFRNLAPALAGLYDANDHAQFGLSVREGATAMWRVIRTSCSALKRNAVPDQVLLKLDLANAFNSVNRSYIFSTIQQHAPAILPWIQSSYGTSIPHFSDAGTEFSSQVGVRQGDPLSPALFSLVLYCFTTTYAQTCPALQKVQWYLDDGAVLGTPEEVNSIIQTIEREGPAWGLFLNRTKCSIFRITDAPAAVVPNANFPHNVNIHTDGMTVMNLPVVGNSEFFRDSINELIDKHAGKIETIAQLDDVQMEYHALTMCLSFQTVNHVLRAFPRESAQIAFDRFDAAIWREIRRLMKIDHLGTDEESRLRDWMALPTKRGGAGLYRTTDIALPALLGSWGLTHEVVRRWVGTVCSETANDPFCGLDEVRTAIQEWQHRYPNAEFQPTRKQREYSKTVQDTVIEKAREQWPATYQQHLLSNSLKGAGFWLTNPPHDHFKLTDDQFRVSFSLRFNFRVLRTMSAQQAHQRIKDEQWGSHHATTRYATNFTCLRYTAHPMP